MSLIVKNHRSSSSTKSALGHTIVGDYTYSNRRDTHPLRTFLHSFSGNIEHSRSGEYGFSADSQSDV
ncbi:hypothetical protein LSTR_LSTR014238 [Laodelphax striatellus]|uniref:Uncharacterized protein n=1 Tax=Laodelphax striatellus TaxID=195883 RepID=A0A482WPU3_LAOST|nr:hypothetical protein LSTR_LSTR014238 [Laodelphax striatellus]